MTADKATTPSHTSAALDDYLAALVARRPALIDLGLSRIKSVMQRLDNPQNRLPPVFHVAGTNGKGSTLAFIRAILEAHGKSVHAYTSPHLVRFTERIRLAGAEISDDALRAALMAIDAAAGSEPLSFFETFTAAAFRVFADTPADYIALEVGLGGRFDATNIVGAPAASVITPIGLDHQEFLGTTLAQIAREKSGILKPGAPAVIGKQEPEAMAAITDEIEAIGARGFIQGRDWMSWTENGRLIFQDTDGLHDLDPPRLAGPHQFDNAGLAIAAIKAAGLTIDDETISRGLREATWPARLQVIQDGPLYDLLRAPADPSPEVWLDGGHNPHAARVLAATIGGAEEKNSKPLIMIVGMQTNKDTRSFLATFAGMARHVIGVSADHRGARPADDIARLANEAGINAIAAPSFSDGIKKARSLADGPARFLICGSLYLAGEFLTHNAS